MKVPKISIIIPSYNKVKFIGQTLDSIIGQKYPNLEVIIQDGGSTDGTLGIIKKYADKYPKIIRYESKRDKGQLDAINRGLKKATGEILAYINADDVYAKGAFMNIEKAYVKNSNAFWFAGRGRVINSTGHEIAKGVTWYKNLLLSLNFRFFLLVTNYLIQPSVFLTRSALEKFGQFTGTPNFVMEYDYWLRLSTASMPNLISKDTSYFRISERNISSVSYSKLLRIDNTIVKKYTNNLPILILHKINNLLRVVIIKYL
jgi:glycosyltransferase involved in cell wall biosynthesis